MGNCIRKVIEGMGLGFLFGRKNQSKSERNKQTFTRNVEGLGVLTAQGAKESKCRDWCMAVELKDWKDVMLHVDGRLMGSKECLNTIVNEYDKVRLNIDNILASIRKDFSYRKVLKEGHDTMVADGKVDMSLCIGEEDNLFPYVGVAYQSGKYSVWFSVQDGELTCFDVN